MSDFDNPLILYIDHEKFNRNDISLISNDSEQALNIEMKHPNLITKIYGLKNYHYAHVFVLSNAHSLALAELQVRLEGQLSQRKIQSKELSIMYGFTLHNSSYFRSTVYIKNILSNSFYKITDFSKPVNISKIEKEPFFLNDHKHAFFVDIKEKPKPLPKVATYGYDVPVILVGEISNISDLSKYAEIPDVSIGASLEGGTVVDPTRINTTSLIDTLEPSVVLNNNSGFVFDEAVLTIDRHIIDNNLGRIES